MNEDVKKAKQNMKNKAIISYTYWYYLLLPIFMIVVFLLNFLEISTGNTGTIILVLTVVANVSVRKLTRVSKKKYVAPIVFYIANIVSVLFLPLLLNDVFNGGTGDSYFLVMALLMLPLEIVSIVFFFITAHDIKVAYPTMKQDMKDSREAYLKIKQKN